MRQTGERRGGGTGARRGVKRHAMTNGAKKRYVDKELHVRHLRCKGGEEVLDATAAVLRVAHPSSRVQLTSEYLYRTYMCTPSGVRGVGPRRAQGGWGVDEVRGCARARDGHPNQKRRDVARSPYLRSSPWQTGSGLVMRGRRRQSVGQLHVRGLIRSTHGWSCRSTVVEKKLPPAARLQRLLQLRL